jgi:peptidoglycan/LPS O-acetylase OafA/YrhL
VPADIAALAATEENQLARLDVLRLLASVGIVLFHMHFFGDGPFSEVGNHAGLALLVDLFFVISGVVISHVYAAKLHDLRTGYNFAVRRVGRLMPLHWLTATLFLGANLAAMRWLPQVGVSGREVSCLVPNFLAIHSLGLCGSLSLNWPSWSISAELAVYCLFCAAMMLPRYRIIGLICLAMFAVLAYAGIEGLSERPLYKWTYDGGALRALPSFILGVWMQTNRGAIRRFPAPRLAYLFGLGAFLACVWLAASPYVLMALLYLTVFLAYAADLRHPPSPHTRAVAKWGDLTYPIYLWHSPIFFVVVSVVATGLLDASPQMQDVALIVSFLALPIIAIASQRAFETPLKKLTIAWLSWR